MERFPTPEILRVPLESLSLSVKAVRENEDVKVRHGDLVHCGGRLTPRSYLTSYSLGRLLTHHRLQPWKRRGQCYTN